MNKINTMKIIFKMIFNIIKNNTIHLNKNRMQMKILKIYLNSFKRVIKKDKIII